MFLSTLRQTPLPQALAASAAYFVLPRGGLIQGRQGLGVLVALYNLTEAQAEDGRSNGEPGAVREVRPIGLGQGRNSDQDGIDADGVSRYESVDDASHPCAVTKWVRRTGASTSAARGTHRLPYRTSPEPPGRLGQQPGQLQSTEDPHRPCRSVRSPS